MISSCQQSPLDFFIFFQYDSCMTNEEIKLKIYEKLIAIMVDLYDPSEDEAEETRDDMSQVIEILLQGVDLEVVGESDGKVQVTLSI